MSRRRNLGVAALVTGVAGAAVAAGINAERRAVGRARSAADPYVDEPFGKLHTEGLSVVADDGVALHVEIDGNPDSPLTVVFMHGFTLSMDAFHFQRRDLGDAARLVFYDQRSHGSSERSPAEHCTIDQLGKDLDTVLQAVAPAGPVVLVGHSMGGMTILSLADQRPDLFGDRIAGVALLSTSTGNVAKEIVGVPGAVSRLVSPFVPAGAKLVQRRAATIERGRRVGSDVGFLFTRFISYGPGVPPSLVAFMEQMVSATPIEVMSQFFDTFLSHDKLTALDVLKDLPVLISCGSKDVLTPLSHSQVMADALPAAEFQVLPGANHMAKLERHDDVNAALRRLFDRASERAAIR
ncbi:MAG TPA: alpha/beta hydrolase [Mycobacteriales bacterium]|jgi:pimeloyl-ACP methyl ester carboxylesterase|nr:alpha/beta hydrolase [Mycobacteriales bacterium]